MNIEDKKIDRKVVRLSKEETQLAIREYLDNNGIILSDDVDIKHFGSGQTTITIDYISPVSERQPS